jgi:hypothetical protein
MMVMMMTMMVMMIMMMVMIVMMMVMIVMMMMSRRTTPTLPIKGMVITGLCCQSCIHSPYTENTEHITNLKISTLN